MLIQFDIEMIFPSSTDQSIHIQIKWTTEVSIMTEIIVPGWVEYNLATSEYPYCRAYI